MNKFVEEFEDCSPRADSLIHSLRAFGYGLGMAIADLIDNSIFAESQLITIDYDWNDADPWIRIMDDGTGMSEKELLNAMKFGSSSPLEVRDPKDLGRFGLGMKNRRGWVSILIGARLFGIIIYGNWKPMSIGIIL